MSEYLFGVSRVRVSKKEAARRDRICKKHGGYGYNQIDESHGTQEGGRWVGWYAGPNRGAPFDGQLASAVLAEVERGV